MNERDFSQLLKVSIEKFYLDSCVLRPVDSFNLGVPDLIAVIPGRPLLAVEVKQLQRYVKDPMEVESRREGPLLQHKFQGPQISMLRKLKKAGAEVYGLIRVTQDFAFRVDPDEIPNVGNFTHLDLLQNGRYIRRKKEGWIFWDP